MTYLKIFWIMWKKIENFNYDIKFKLDEEKSKADRFINRCLNMEDK